MHTIHLTIQKDYLQDIHTLNLILLRFERQLLHDIAGRRTTRWINFPTILHKINNIQWAIAGHLKALWWYLMKEIVELLNFQTEVWFSKLWLCTISKDFPQDNTVAPQVRCLVALRF